MEAFNNDDFGALYGGKPCKAMGGGQYAGTVGALTMQTKTSGTMVVVHQRKLSGYGAVSEQPYEDQVDATVAYNGAGAFKSASGSRRLSWHDGGGWISMAKLLEETNNTNVKISVWQCCRRWDHIKDGFITSGHVEAWWTQGM